MSTILKQAQPTFGELAGNGKTYEVPPFQRDYSWDREEWEDLWLDLLALETDGEHYMGYLVMQETEQPKHFIVIDGQQRITTISLLILATVQYLLDRGDTERAEDLQHAYLSSRNIATRVNVPKLKLNYNNEYIYAGKLLQLSLPPNLSGLKPSEKKLIGAFHFFYNNIKERFGNKDTETITAFITKEVDVKLFFTSITVKDDLNAFKVFETLNARGTKLSTADLLKNFLFSIIYSPGAGSISHEERKWHRINDMLGRTDVSTYLRHFWNGRYFPSEKKSTLFKAIKKEIKTQADAMRLLNDLDDSVGIYAAFSNPLHEIWTAEQAQLIQELKTLEVSQCFAVLMMAKAKFPETEFNRALKDIVVISFRYNTIAGQNPNELERIYNKASIAIYKNEIHTARQLFVAHLKDAYIDDNSFKNDFQNKAINTKRYNRLVKYVLGKLEQQYGGRSIDLNGKSVSVEHILPESPDEHWTQSFGHADVDEFMYKIGNLTLLESAKNKEADRQPFPKKLMIYQTSQYRLANVQTAVHEWTAGSIAARQRNMANKAVAIWKIDYR